MISEIKGLDLNITDEGDVALFLGIQIYTEDDGDVTIPQPSIIDIIIQTL